MQENVKKQFSLSMLVRVFLAIIVVVSLVVFANSVMRYNQLKEEEAELEAMVEELTLLKEELTVLAGSSEELSRILSDYAEYKKLLSSGSDLGIHLAELEAKIEACLAAQGLCGSDYMKLQELQAQQAELEAQLEAKMERWVYLNELKEKIDAQ